MGLPVAEKENALTPLPSRTVRTLAIVAGIASAVAIVALGYGLFTAGAGSSTLTAVAQTPAPAPAPTAAENPPAAIDPWTGSAAATGSTLATTASAGAATSTAAKTAPLAVSPSVAGAGKLDLYRGLGSWVDIYDTKAWDNPTAAVADMAAHGVRTLYVETGNSRSSFAIFNPTGQQAFIRECHAHGMRVVAWYLPDLKPGSADFSRISQAIAFTTADGQKFDSFALDIESTVVSSEAERNRNLEALTKQIRALVGRAYPLGGIIPSPVGIAKKAGYWDAFPYSMVASYYDVFLPMAYYTYHGSTATAAGADALANVRILRSQPGCATVPIHMIGGIAENSSAGEVKAFVSAVRQTKCFGASLYGWPGTSAAHWQALAAIGR